jgi:sterol desaturase/sphingolipid hydroxylase (fatty acid hydroxylase superfamily)
VFRTALSRLLFPVVFGAALGAGFWGAKTDIHHAVLLASILVSVLLILMVFERVHPEHSEWNEHRGDIGTDLLHAGVSGLLVPRVVEAAIVVLLAGAVGLLADLVGSTPWPDAWPLGVQLIGAMLISQFFEYWFHRLSHTVPLLWRLHATHHSPGRLYWLNASRFHPLDRAGSVALSFGSVTLLGANPEVLLLMAIWIAVHGLFQHCNIRLRLGPLNWVFSMAELHRWHHSPRIEEANNNYGANILFWDIVFGTVYWPRDRRADAAVGLHDLPAFPQDYMGQLASPLRWRVIESAGDGSHSPTGASS